MLCIKTGFHAYSTGRNLFYYGDAFVLAAPGAALDYSGDEEIKGLDHLLLRISAESYEPQAPRLQIEFTAEEHWFDEQTARCFSYGRDWPTPSTMIIKPHQWRWLGYTGQPFTKEQDNG